MLRGLIALIFLVVAAAIVALAFQTPAGSPWSGLWLNLGTEIVGIVLTVAIVEWLFERRRHAEDARRVAWDVLHETDHAIWVWQGGRREFDLGELLVTLRDVGSADPIPSFTQNLLMRIGSRSENTLRNRPEVGRANRRLAEALKTLSGLSRIRDDGRILPAKEVAACLGTAVGQLMKALRLSVPAPLPVTSPLRDPASARQEMRHYGMDAPIVPAPAEPTAGNG
jgi:hypothetical protein